MGVLVLAAVAFDGMSIAGARSAVGGGPALVAGDPAIAAVHADRSSPSSVDARGAAALDGVARGWAGLAPGERSVPDAGCSAAAATPGGSPKTASTRVVDTSSASRSLSRSTAATRPIAAFLGDSYTSGYNGAGYGRAGWPALVSAAIKLRELNRAVPGTGFVNAGWTGQPIRTQVAAVVRANPRIVFLVGGHNDRRYPTATTRAAAMAVIDRLHRDVPHATLVVIGPIWSGDVAPPSLVSLRDALRRKARRVGAQFVDPIAGRWLAGSAKRFIGSDGLHPTNAGHRHIAALVLGALRARERTRPTSRQAPAVAGPPASASPAIGPRREIALSPCGF